MSITVTSSSTAARPRVISLRSANVLAVGRNAGRLVHPTALVNAIQRIAPVDTNRDGTGRSGTIEHDEETLEASLVDEAAENQLFWTEPVIRVNDDSWSGVPPSSRPSSSGHPSDFRIRGHARDLRLAGRSRDSPVNGDSQTRDSHVNRDSQVQYISRAGFVEDIPVQRGVPVLSLQAIGMRPLALIGGLLRK